MAIIRALEDLDEGLAITQVIHEDQSAAQIPTHDQLYLDKAEEVAEVKEKAEAEPEDAPTDTPAEPEAQTEDAEPPEEGDESSGSGEEATGEESEPVQEVDGKQTTVAAESLRNEDRYSRFALESFGEESLVQRGLGAAWSGVKALSGYALHIATELGGYLKDLGIEYGPKVYARLRSGVSYLLNRAFKSFMKMRSAASRSYFQYSNSFTSHSKKLERLRKILDEMPDAMTVMRDEPFQDEEIFNLFTVGGQTSPLKSLSAMGTLLDVVVKEIDRGVKNEIGTMKQVIEVCRRNARVDSIHYLRIVAPGNGFMKRSVPGYDKAPELTETFAFAHALPKNTLVVASLPRHDVVEAATRSGDLTEVSNAYQESYMVLGVNQVQSKADAMVNYMDKKSLYSLLNGLESLIEQAKVHVKFYKDLEESAARLKPDFQNYFSWLTEDEKAKSMRQSLVEVIYLKQSFVTKVYLPCAIDIHAFTSDYVAKLLRYTEDNIKVLKPVEPASAA